MVHTLAFTETTLLYFAITSALSVGASYIAYQLNKPKDAKPQLDSKEPALASRGSYVPLVMGRRKLSPVIAYDGGLQAVKQDSGGKGFGASGPSSYTYRKAGWHLLSLGVGDRIDRIWYNGKQILNAPVLRADSPSGSRISTKRGHFYVYWGELDQPVNAVLGGPKRVGVASRWPGVFYAHWDRANLQGQPVWPTLEYDVTVGLRACPFTETLALRGGVNPAAALWQALTAPAPFGVGMPAARLDQGGFAAMSAVCVAEGLGLSVRVADGGSVADLVTQVMSEVGFVLTQVGRSLVPVMVRGAAGTPPDLTDDMLVDPDPEVKQQHGDEASPNRTIFLFSDPAQNFKSSDVPLDDDGSIRETLRQQAKTVTLPDVIDKDVAKGIAVRRAQQELVDGVGYTLRGTRQCRLLIPGAMFTLAGVGRLRVASVQPAYDTTQVTVDALVDQYGDLLTDTPPGDPDGPAVDTPDALSPDAHVRAFNVPSALSGLDGPQITVARVRASEVAVGAEVQLSADGSSYSVAGRQDAYATGGTLNRPLSAVEGLDTGEIADAPTVSPWVGDVSDTLDLTGNDAAWLAGDQLALIGDEFFMLRKVEAVAGGWRLIGLRRAAFGTAPAFHAVNSDVYIVQTKQQRVLRGGPVVSGALLYVKSRPYGQDDVVDLADVDPVTVTVL